ncbi:MAG: hypothetical protein ACHQWU_08170 [Gemmatimonadales bacterium]
MTIRMRTLIPLGLLATFVLPAAMAAQQAPGAFPIDSVSIGAPVRVRADRGHRVSGTFAGVTAGSLLVADCEGCVVPAHFALPAIRRLEVARRASAGRQVGKAFADGGLGALMGMAPWDSSSAP